MFNTHEFLMKNCIKLLEANPQWLEMTLFSTNFLIFCRYIKVNKHNHL